MPREEARGSLLSMIVPEDRNRAQMHMDRILAGEESIGNEYTFLRKEGSTYPVIIHSRAITRDNHTVGLRGVIVDITELKRLRRVEKMESNTSRCS